MALYAMGDLHLPSTRGFDMDAFGSIWHDHVRKIRKNWLRRVGPDDTIVLTGDHSWGRNLDQALPDLEWIAALPGTKILLRGNHDMFWESGRTQALNDTFAGRLFFLQNNFYTYGPVALVGTKGYCWEGLDSPDHADKLQQREAERLARSFDAAEQAGYRRFIVFLHYPPTGIGQMTSPLIDLCRARGAEQVIYSHAHGEYNYHTSYEGTIDGINYELVSSDYLRFKPLKILD